jgi:hypothetical protein
MVVWRKWREMVKKDDRMTSMRLKWSTKTALDALAVEIQSRRNKKVSSEAVVRYLITQFRPDIAEKYGITTTEDNITDPPKP